MITYRASLDDVEPEYLEGFFVGRPFPVAGARLMQVLRGSSHVVVAWESDRVVGFINALSDGVLSSFIPLLEVRPEHQGRGIGRRLVETMLGEIGGLYAVDLVCDETLAPYYERLGGSRLAGIGWRNRAVL